MAKSSYKIAYKWEMIMLLWFAFFLNQGDRQIYNVVIPLIREDLRLSDVQLGLVATIFTHTPTLYFLSLAFGGMIFVHIGFVTWMSTFLHEKFSLSLSNAGFFSMFYHHLFAFGGVLMGGRISDKLSLKRKLQRGLEFQTLKEMIPLYDIEAEIEMKQNVASVNLVPKNEPLDFTREDGKLKFVLPKLEGHQFVEIGI